MSDAQISSPAPGVEAHVAGQDATDKSAAGAVAGGGPLEGLGPAAPSGEALNDSGDTVADDAVPPEKGLPGDGDSVTGQADAASGDGPTP